MKRRWIACSVFTVVIFAVFAAQSQEATTPNAIPEMSRLAKMLVGDWNTKEDMEHSDFFPDGGGRHGTTHWKLGIGGTTLVGEGHSDGSAGELNYLIAIWWDKPASVYRFFTCFNDPNTPCVVRGTAHWEGDSFVNDYDETVKGEKKKFRDTFVQTAPNSRSLVEAIETGDGRWKPLITTTSTRR
jgi:hypothetical protein